MTTKLTLGPHAMRMVAGEVRRTIPRQQIVGLDRFGDACVLIWRGVDGDPPAESLMTTDSIPPDEAQAIEDWLLDGSPGQLVPADAQGVVSGQAARPDPVQEIGVGSFVEYLGQRHRVTREAHHDGIRRWRLDGHTSRGVNESALRLITPFRVGDVVEAHVEGQAGQMLRLVAIDFQKDDDLLWLAKEDGTGNQWTISQGCIVHATRDIIDAEGNRAVLVLR